jgi:WD40 repeat protein
MKPIYIFMLFMSISVSPLTAAALRMEDAQKLQAKQQEKERKKQAYASHAKYLQKQKEEGNIAELKAQGLPKVPEEMEEASSSPAQTPPVQQSVHYVEEEPKYTVPSLSMLAAQALKPQIEALALSIYKLWQNPAQDFNTSVAQANALIEETLKISVDGLPKTVESMLCQELQKLIGDDLFFVGGAVDTRRFSLHLKDIKADYPTAFNPQGTLLGVGGAALKLFNVADGKQYRVPSIATTPDGLAFNKAGNVLAASSLDGITILFDVDTQQTKRLPDGYYIFGSDAFSPDGSLIAAAKRDDGSFVLINIATQQIFALAPGQEIAAGQPRQLAVSHFSFNAQGRKLAYAIKQNIYWIDITQYTQQAPHQEKKDAQAEQKYRKRYTAQGTVGLMSLSPQGNLLVYQEEFADILDGNILLLNLTTKKASFITGYISAYRLRTLNFNKQGTMITTDFQNDAADTTRQALIYNINTKKFVYACKPLVLGSPVVFNDQGNGIAYYNAPEEDHDERGEHKKERLYTPEGYTIAVQKFGAGDHDHSVFKPLGYPEAQKNSPAYNLEKNIAFDASGTAISWVTPDGFCNHASLKQFPLQELLLILGLIKTSQVKDSRARQLSLQQIKKSPLLQGLIKKYRQQRSPEAKKEEKGQALAQVTSYKHEGFTAKDFEKLKDVIEQIEIDTAKIAQKIAHKQSLEHIKTEYEKKEKQRQERQRKLLQQVAEKQTKGAELSNEEVGAVLEEWAEEEEPKAREKKKGRKD